MTNDSQPKSWLERLGAIFNSEPKDRESLVSTLRKAESHHLLNSESLNMIEGVMQVSEMQVRDIMIPRSKMIIIESDKHLDEILPVIIQSGHSRFPVIGEHKDEVVGILLAKELLKYYLKTSKQPFDINKFLRPAIFIPESKRLDALLREFRDKHNHLAIVADEYGNIAGLVTIEDVLEQIVGDIEDEYDIDEDAEHIRKLSKNEYNINALTTIDDFNEAFHTNLSNEEFDTIGGLVLHNFARMPKRGEITTIDGIFRFTILHADNRRIRLMRMKIIK